MATYNPMYYLDEAANFLKKPAQNVWQNLTAPGNTQGLAYEDQIAALDDRQKLADQLQAQADQPFNIQSYKGIQAPISGYEGAAKMLSAALAGWEGGGIAGERRAATKAEKAAIQSGFADIFKRGDLVEQGAQQPDDAEGIPQYAANTQVGGGKYILTPEAQQRRLIGLVGDHPGAAGQANLYSNLIGDERARAEDLQDRDAAAIAAENIYQRNRENVTTDAALKRGQQVGDETRRRLTTKELSDAGYRPGTVAYTDGLGRITVPQAGEPPSQIANANRVPTMRFVTVNGPDGKPKRVMMSDAEIVAAQASGENVSDTVVKALPRLTSQQFIKLGETLTADINSANRLKSYMSDAKDVPQGFKLIAQDFANKFTTAFGGTLSGDALKVAMQQGTLQSLIGNLRIETVGGGVMTEQDALRVIQALGGDLSLLRNKDVVEGQIQKILELKEARIKQNMQFYNRDAENQGVAPMEYGSPAAGNNRSGESPFSTMTNEELLKQMETQ